MDSSEEHAGCPARGTCPVFLAMSAGTVRYAPSGLCPVLEGNLREEPWGTDSPPQPDQGLPPPLAAVPVPWKSTDPCQGHRESPGALVETSAGEEAQGQEGPAAAQLDVLRLRSSSMEIREKGSEFLKEELHRAQKELKLKDEECERLSKVREQLEQELEELTASLFEEAHKMVREANMKQAASEKQLKEARGKVDTILFAEFQAWRESPTLDKTCPFLERVYREDVGPCLDFTMQELSVLVRAAVEDNTLTIEPVASQTLPTVKVAEVDCSSTNTCALSGLTRTCRHRIRLGDSKSHYYISPSSRARITAVCNFFTYIRYIQQGLVRQDAHSARPGSPLLHQPLLAAESSPEPVWPDPLSKELSPLHPGGQVLLEAKAKACWVLTPARSLDGRCGPRLTAQGPCETPGRHLCLV
ncbi:guanine nucleotide exchange factor for Rab-3A isoform X6 [Homo sapiens]|uniref:guanine nucleotide exchange factor for Rab-3A isoform X6 n=1 Tax=Homo sapiens TaxID=9606 RepID=UPI0005CFF611|nr:guanine nucleotide exchange factor for Rab-3A isoform X6 [Homo sapiens]XP_054225556.1 guanine nucleotide exchange factor for Rab-3A isoform X6 [Homo sapiens]|eukprot:XP_011543501.1 guanine nucleotide exchange factor for Rab-3A isoform X6 [Homo sapiens]